MKLSLNRDELSTVAPALLCSLAVVSLWTSDTRGDIFITASECKTGTTVRWSGSLDLSELEPAGEASAPEGSVFAQMGMLSGSSQSSLDVYYFSHLKLLPFGNGGGKLQTSSKGDCLLLTNTTDGSGMCVCVPSGYSGETISGEIFFAGESLKSLGIDSDCSLAYDLGGQYISFFSDPDKVEDSGLKKRKLTRTKASNDKRVIPICFFLKRNSEDQKTDFLSTEVPMVQVTPLRQ